MEAISVYWMSLAWNPKGILEKARKIGFSFLWVGNQDKFIMPWVSWKVSASPKLLGGWGLKKIFLSSKELVAKVYWRLISSKSLWTTMAYQKHIFPDTFEDWI